MTDQNTAPALDEERAFLERARSMSGPARFFAYLRRGGPGYLQSAMTLGGGTAISSIYAGRMFGYELLWVAPVGMLIGVLMLGVLGGLTLGDERRPYVAMGASAGKVFAVTWALGALVASIIWHFPQYALAGAALSDVATVAGTDLSPAVAAVPVLLVALTMSSLYGRSPRLVRAYETVVKALIVGVILCFGLVVAATAAETDWGAVARGFVPSLPEPRGNTSSATIATSGLAAAVGINMVFLYPYSLRARGWGGEHRGFARFDLVAGMLVPYTIATTLVVIATANTIPWEEGDPVEKMMPVDAARAFGSVLGATNGRLVFDLGLVGMALSTIALHMVCSGLALAELCGVGPESRAYKVGLLLPVPGVLGPVYWDNLLWLVVPTNIVCGLFLPLTYVGLILWARRANGAARPRGATVAAMAVFTLFLVAMLGKEVFKLLG